MTLAKPDRLTAEDIRETLIGLAPTAPAAWPQLVADALNARLGARRLAEAASNYNTADRERWLLS